MDDDQSLYAADTTTRIIEMLQANLAYTFNTYFEATPTTPPPATDFPICIVQELVSPVVLGPTQADEVHETLQLTFILNRADDIGSANIRTTTMRHLKNVIAGMDPTTNTYKEGTVLYVLRKFLTLDQWLINNNVTVKYDIVPQTNEPSLCVADVTLETWRRVMVAGRQ